MNDSSLELEGDDRQIRFKSAPEFADHVSFPLSPAPSSMSRAFCRYSKPLCSTFQLLNLCRQARYVPNLCQSRLISSYINAADLRFGQPLHETHPHLLQPGEGRDNRYFRAGRCSTDDLMSSHTRHHCTRICATTNEARGTIASQRDSSSCCIGYCISHRTCFL